MSADIDSILSLLGNGVLQKEIAEKFGVTQQYISKVARLNRGYSTQKVIQPSIHLREVKEFAVSELQELRQRVVLLDKENQRLHRELLKAGRNQRKAISNKTRFAIFQRDGFRCRCCGKSAANDMTVELQIDHILPVVKGGTNDLSNLQTLCKECNNGKRTETVDFVKQPISAPVAPKKKMSQQPIIQKLF